MIYKWKTGSRLNFDANAAGAVCEQLEQTVGLTARNLLDASRDEDAPLHGQFEWNDTVAAERFREDQARYIIRSLTVIHEETQTETRAFFNIVQGDQQYSNVRTIMLHAETRKALLNVAIRELAAFRSKYGTLSELANVFAEIDRITA